MTGKLVILSGPSGAGKSTIVEHLRNITDFNFGFSVSATTRSKRSHETNGVEYFFLSIDEFKSRIEENEFLEWEEVYPGLYYGTLKSEINKLIIAGKNLIFDVDVVGGTNIKRHYADRALSIFIQPPSIEILEERLKKRNTESDESIARRIKKSKLEMTFARRFEKVIINENLDTTQQEVEKLVREFLMQ